jgi:hypothetical protein
MAVLWSCVSPMILYLLVPIFLFFGTITQEKDAAHWQD